VIKVEKELLYAKCHFLFGVASIVIDDQSLCTTYHNILVIQLNFVFLVRLLQHEYSIIGVTVSIEPVPKVMEIGYCASAIRCQELCIVYSAYSKYPIYKLAT